MLAMKHDEIPPTTNYDALPHQTTAGLVRSFLATRSWPSKHDARLYCGSQQSQFALFSCSRRSRHGYLIKGLEFSLISLRGDILTSPSRCEALRSLPIPGETALQSGMLGASPAPRLCPNNPQTPHRHRPEPHFMIDSSSVTGSSCSLFSSSL
jgi:hypothetical protein